MMAVDINCYADVRHDREVYRTQTLLMSWLTTVKRIIFLPNGNCFPTTRGLSVVIILNNLMSYFSDEIKEIKDVIEPFQKFQTLWSINSVSRMDEFLENAPEPNIVDFQTKFMEFAEVEKDLLNMYDIFYVGPLEIHTSSFKYIALKQLRQHQQV